MKLLAVLALCGLTVGVSASSSQPGPATPGPDVKRMAAFAGTWLYEGTCEATPIGPAAKVSGSQTGKMIMGGFVLQWTGQESGAFGGVQWGETDVYDTSTRSYTLLGYQNDGTTWTGSFSISGSTWKSTTTTIFKGAKYSTRSEMVLAADGKTATWRADLSADGRTWVKWQEQRLTKQ